MCAHGVETMHEFPHNFNSHKDLQEWLYAGTPDSPHGYVDGWAIAIHPELVKECFKDYPIVIIDRDINDVLISWKKWVPGPLDFPRIKKGIDNLREFREWSMRKNSPASLIPYSSLSTYETCDTIAKYCTGRSLSYATWRTFDRFKIEVRK
jgi:hypothetical protein